MQNSWYTSGPLIGADKLLLGFVKSNDFNGSVDFLEISNENFMKVCDNSGNSIKTMNLWLNKLLPWIKTAMEYNDSKDFDANSFCRISAPFIFKIDPETDGSISKDAKTMLYDVVYSLCPFEFGGDTFKSMEIRGKFRSSILTKTYTNSKKKFWDWAMVEVHGKFCFVLH